MKTLIFGGTFNPVHLGHLFILHVIAEKTDYERVIMLPSRHPVHKKYRKEITNEQRLDLLYKGVEDYHDFYFSDRKLEIVIDECELTRPSESYTYESVIDIYQRYDIDGKLAVIVGDDLVEELPAWHRAEELFPLVHFLVVTRETGKSFPAGVDGRWIDVEPIDCSSSRIRELLHSHTGDIQELHALLSDGVLDYILDYELYKED